MSTNHHTPGAYQLPRLSDEAVVQIHLFINQFLDFFEARYGDQIHRYYEERSQNNLIEPHWHSDIDDPPF